jgi:sortase A
VATVLTLRDIAERDTDGTDDFLLSQGSLLAVVWTVVVLACMGFGLVGFEPLFQQRTQSRMLDEYRTTLRQAAAAAVDPTTTASVAKVAHRGAPVALLEIQAIRLQQVVVEGVQPRQTRNGPGHVPGSAGPGQPGNAVVVGRHSAYGGPFRSIAKLRIGDRVVVTTTQGQSTYRVVSNTAPSLSGASVGTIEGPSQDDRITLITSRSSWPLNSKNARVVVARMEHAAFPPTKQANRTGRELGSGREHGAWIAALLGLGALAAGCAGAVWCYRNLSTRTAYLVSAVPLVVLAVVASEAVSRWTPAWL